MEDVQIFFEKQPEIIKLLEGIASLGLDEAYLCAGALRNTLWNQLTAQENHLGEKDLDVIFYDPQRPYEENWLLQAELQKKLPGYQWEVKNQAYMAGHSGRQEPYRSVREALAHFPERCTAIGARLYQGQVELLCPYGVADILSLQVRPTPDYLESSEKFQIYLRRVTQKNWQAEWPTLAIQKKIDKKSR